MTVEFSDRLYRRLKTQAVRRGKTVNELVIEGVRMVLASPARGEDSKKEVEFPLIISRRRKPLDIPDDAAFRVELVGDLESHAVSYGQSQDTD